MWIAKTINKYGHENFTIEEIEKCNSIDELNLREQFWIKELNTLAPNGYNLTTGGWNAKRTEEHKRKLSLSKTGIPSKKKGRKQTPQELQKNIDCHGVEIFEITTGQVFKSAQAAADYFGCSNSGISTVCRKLSNSIFGMKFDYVDANQRPKFKNKLTNKDHKNANRSVEHNSNSN